MLIQSHTWLWGHKYCYKHNVPISGCRAAGGKVATVLLVLLNIYYSMYLGYLPRLGTYYLMG